LVQKIVIIAARNGVTLLEYAFLNHMKMEFFYFYLFFGVWVVDFI